MKADYHIHTRYCGHAKGSVREYVRAALQLGMEEICFADHLHRYYLTPEERETYWDWGMPEDLLEKYVAEVLQAREDFPEIRIRLGVEADYVEGHEQELERILNQYPFDHVLASIHCHPQIGWMHITDAKAILPPIVYDLFFDALTRAAKTGLFTCAAHPDFIWRYFPWPEEGKEDILKRMDEFVAAVAENGNMSVEANSNAVMWMMSRVGEERDLFEVLFRMVVAHKAPITLGSDAHRPLHLAGSFGQTISILESLGIKKMAVFKERKMKMVRITPEG